MPTSQPRSWDRRDLIALTVIVLVAALTRMWTLADPHELIFDETYYARDACWYVNHSESICERGPDAPEVHPPLGKWLIAMGIRATGFDCPEKEICEGSTTSLGWRIVPAIAGVVTVALLYLLARKLLRSTLGASIAAGALAIDFLHLVQSRTSMLDIFLPLFGVAGFLFLAYDRDQIGARASRVLDRPWRFAAGVAFGAAVASKWSGIFYLIGGIVISLVWERSAARRDEGGEGLARALPSIALYMMVAPLALYLFTYLGRLEGFVWGWPWSEGHWVRAFWDHHRYMLDFHKDLTSNHSYQSPPWSWLALKRPVSYYFCSGQDCETPHPGGDYEEIFAAGNPFVWWTSVLALAYVAYRWIRTRDIPAPEGLILGGFAFTFLPWLISDALTHRPAVFLFYLLPSIPFMCLALAYVGVNIGKSWEAVSAIALFTVGSLAVFVFYWPVLTGKPLLQSHWDARIWIFDNCDKPVGKPVESTVLETIGKRVRTQVVETTSDTSSLPPTGWCWI